MAASVLIVSLYASSTEPSRQRSCSRQLAGLFGEIPGRLLLPDLHKLLQVCWMTQPCICERDHDAFWVWVKVRAEPELRARAGILWGGSASSHVHVSGTVLFGSNVSAGWLGWSTFV